MSELAFVQTGITAIVNPINGVTFDHVDGFQFFRNGDEAQLDVYTEQAFLGCRSGSASKAFDLADAAGAVAYAREWGLELDAEAVEDLFYAMQDRTEGGFDLSRLVAAPEPEPEPELLHVVIEAVDEDGDTVGHLVFEVTRDEYDGEDPVLWETETFNGDGAYRPAGRLVDTFEVSSSWDENVGEMWHGANAYGVGRVYSVDRKEVTNA